MNWFTRLFTPTDRKNASLDFLRQLYSGATRASSGEVVTAANALEETTVLACVRVLANGLSQVPFRIYKQTEQGNEVASDHPLNIILARRPNSWQTSFEFIETLAFHVVLLGNAFVFIDRVGLGKNRKIRGLTIIDPAKVSVEQNSDYSITYKVTGKDGTQQIIPQADVWHVRGPSWNSWMGLEAVKQARDAIGLSMALETSHSELHKNGASTSGLLSVKDSLAPEQYEFMAAWLDKYEIGGERYRKPMILDREATFTPMGMSGVDAQHLETRKHQVEEICRAFGVMPIMVGQSDKAATYASAEQMFLAHVVHTLSPWYRRFEQSVDANLLTEEEMRGGLYSKFTPNALMRGDANTRSEYYTRALGSGGSKGWLTQNEVRALEEFNASDEEEADMLPQPPEQSAPEAQDDTMAEAGQE